MLGAVPLTARPFHCTSLYAGQQALAYRVPIGLELPKHSWLGLAHRGLCPRSPRSSRRSSPSGRTSSSTPKPSLGTGMVRPNAAWIIGPNAAWMVRPNAAWILGSSRRHAPKPEALQSRRDGPDLGTPIAVVARWMPPAKQPRRRTSRCARPSRRFLRSAPRQRRADSVSIWGFIQPPHGRDRLRRCASVC